MIQEEVLKSPLGFIAELGSPSVWISQRYFTHSLYYYQSYFLSCTPLVSQYRLVS